MKKTVVATAVALALGVPLSALADTDQLDTPGAIETKGSGGAKTMGLGSKAENKAKGSYNNSLTDSANSNISSGFNDVNSNNRVTIEEDGIVSYAQDLNQAIASSDLNNVIGAPGGTAAAPFGTTGLGGNMLVDNSLIGGGAQAIQSNNVVGFTRGQYNTIGNGSFNNFGGVSSTSQDLGSMAEVGQSVVIQSNGSL